MKTIFILVFALGIGMPGKSQFVKISQLIEKTNCPDYTCFNEFILKEGFSLGKSGTESDGRFYLYLSEMGYTTTSNRAVNTRNQAAFMIHTDGSVSTLFGTGLKHHYQKQMKHLLKLGFRKTTAETNDSAIDAVETKYASKRFPNIEVSVITKIMTHDGKSWTQYEFSVHKLK